MANSPIFPGSIINHALELDSADTTALVDFITAGSKGTRVNSISAVSDDTADINLILYYNDGSSDFKLGRITIPAGSGTDGTNPPISILNATSFPFLGEDLSYYIKTGGKLRVSALATITATKKLHLVSICGDY